MDDLISRKAAIEYLMTNMGWYDVDGYEVDDADKIRTCIEDLINGIPSVPAVPLDKLCEFLEKCGADSYCRTCKQIMGECFADGRECGSEHFWKELLTKWKKGLDGSESMV